MISIMVRETKEVYQQKIEPILLKLIKRYVHSEEYVFFNSIFTIF